MKQPTINFGPGGSDGRGRPPLRSVSVGLGTISCLTVRPKQLAGELAGSGAAATRAVNLLIVFGIQ